MVAPNAAGASFDVFLAFALDEEANKRVEQRVSTIQEELKRIQEEAKGAGKETNKAMKGNAEAAKETAKQVKFVGSAYAAMEQAVKKASKTTQEAANKDIAKLKQLQETAKRMRTESALISGAASRGLMLSTKTFALGAGIVGGAFLEANNYVTNTKESTQATREWTAATEELAKARKRVDVVLLKEALPLLQKAAELATKASKFVEKNPEIVGAALKVGAVMAALGAIGMAVTTGIKLVADAAYIASVATELVAAKLHDKAANKELLAAGMKNKAGVTNTANDLRKAFGLTTAAEAGGAVGAGGIAATVATVIAVILAGVGVGLIVNEVAARLGIKGFTKTNQFLTGGAYSAGKVIGKTLGQDDATIERKSLIFAAVVGRLTGAIDSSSPLWQKATKKIEETNEALDGLGVGDNAEAIVQAWETWQDEIKRIQEDGTKQSLKIVEDARQKEIDSAIKYRNTVQDIMQSSSGNIASIISNYATQMQEAEVQYGVDRANILKDSNETIRNIEKDHQEEQRRLFEEHNSRVADLVSSRDALGLVKEERAYIQQREEAERSVNEQIKEQKRETALQLQELATRYAQERAQKQAQYQQDLAAEYANRAQRLKEAQLAHQAELTEIRNAKQQQLNELQRAMRDERIKARQGYIDTIRDLDAALLGEKNLRKTYYANMLSDAQQWMQQYRATLGGSTLNATATGGVAIRDSGGYAGKGIYGLAMNGQREFVLSGSSTKAAEQVIGGSLSQDSMLQAFAALSSMRKGLQYNDNRKFNTAISTRDRRAIQQETRDAILSAMNGMVA